MSEDKDKAEIAAVEQDGEPQPESDVPAAARSAGGGISWLALILALAALGLAAWQWFGREAQPEDHWAAASEQVQLIERLGEVESRLAAFESELSELDRPTVDPAALERSNEAIRGLESGLSRLEGELAEQDERLQSRMTALEARDGEQRQADRELDRRMLMLEAAGLLRLGQERAELAADLDLAAAAYRRAGELLRRADDPRLGQVRRDLARELEALENVERPDWLQIQARLERLAAQAPAWTTIGSADQGTELLEKDEETTTAGRWTGALRETFGQLVRVRPRDAAELGEEEIDLLRQQAVLRLTAAELAAARRDPAELEHHLAAAGRLLEAHFDASDPAVAETLAYLRERGGPARSEAPLGLGAALVGLRELLERG
jgi:uroporphyrin-III C-methyltransferase